MENSLLGVETVLWDNVPIMGGVLRCCLFGSLAEFSAIIANRGSLSLTIIGPRACCQPPTNQNLFGVRSTVAMKYSCHASRGTVNEPFSGIDIM